MTNPRAQYLSTDDYTATGDHVIDWYAVTLADGTTATYGWCRDEEELLDADGARLTSRSEASAVQRIICAAVEADSAALGQRLGRQSLAVAAEAGVAVEQDAEVAYDRWLADAAAAGDWDTEQALRRADVMSWSEGYEAAVAEAR